MTELERSQPQGRRDTVDRHLALGRSTEEVRLLRREKAKCTLHQQKQEIESQPDPVLNTVIILNLLKPHKKNL